MKLSNIKAGMKLLAVGDYADCIHKGRTYAVAENGNGELHIQCDIGEHILDVEMVEDGTEDSIPELEPAEQ